MHEKFSIFKAQSYLQRNEANTLDTTPKFHNLPFRESMDCCQRVADQTRERVSQPVTMQAPVLIGAIFNASNGEIRPYANLEGGAPCGANRLIDFGALHSLPQVSSST